MRKPNTYRQDYCFTGVDLFYNFDQHSVKMPKNIRKDKTKREDKKEFFAYMLAYLLYLIVLDIVKNNVTFVFPLVGNREACFYVKSFEGEELQKCMQRGRFEGIDIVASEFKAYQIYFQYVVRNKDIREKPVYISHNVKDIFYENINNGKKYY